MINSNEVLNGQIEVLADDGKVALSGPDGIVLITSPEEAEETSDRLWKWAMHARRQRRHTDSSD